MVSSIILISIFTFIALFGAYMLGFYSYKLKLVEFLRTLVAQASEEVNILDAVHQELSNKKKNKQKISNDEINNARVALARVDGQHDILSKFSEFL